MLCADFENQLTDYLDGALDAGSNQLFAEHALRCPVCHELLSDVKQSVSACRTAEVPVLPSPALEAEILAHTVPEAWMNCEEFEEHLTDYLDGFLPAPVYRRWQRHAASCERCTELPGQVVRAIGACYTYINEELEVPAGLHSKILQATLGTHAPVQVRLPLSTRLAEALRAWIDPLVSPQFATVATMLLVAVLVLTNTVSADGSISGMYQASLRLAEQTYAQGASAAIKGASLSGDIKQITNNLTNLMSEEQHAIPAAMKDTKREEQKPVSPTKK